MIMLEDQESLDLNIEDAAQTHCLSFRSKDLTVWKAQQIKNTGYRTERNGTKFTPSPVSQQQKVPAIWIISISTQYFKCISK